MMGAGDYVLGLEPGNCHPDGRRKMREEGKLTILPPGGRAEYQVEICLFSRPEEWEQIKG